VLAAWDVAERVERDYRVEGTCQHLQRGEERRNASEGTRSLASDSITEERSTPVYRRRSASATASIPAPHPSSKTSEPGGMRERISDRKLRRTPLSSASDHGRYDAPIRSYPFATML
jgi:hypothetical protein